MSAKHKHKSTCIGACKLPMFRVAQFVKQLFTTVGIMMATTGSTVYTTGELKCKNVNKDFNPVSECGI